MVTSSDTIKAMIFRAKKDMWNDNGFLPGGMVSRWSAEASLAPHPLIDRAQLILTLNKLPLAPGCRVLGDSTAV